MQVLQALHDLDRVDPDQRLFEVAKSVENLTDTAATNHFKNKVNLVVAHLLHAVVLDYVWVV